MIKRTKLLIVIFIISTTTFAQSTITGTILNQNTLVPIKDVNILLENQAKGGISNQDGTFEITSSNSKTTLIFTSIGYRSKRLNVKTVKKHTALGIIYLQPIPYPLDGISINAGLSDIKDLPVSVSTITAKDIETKLGSRPLPMIMQTTPGIFSVRNGGGSGDSRLSIRGFQQEDVSLLLNGIPINGQENGLVYWSNWLGLSTAATEIQIQKGPGLTNASISAIGGSINIITLNAQKQKSGSISFEITDFGNLSTSISLNSGQLSNGWNTSLMISFSKGPGYVDATYVNSFAYFFTAQKQLNKQHKLTITLLGAPQEHGQRTIKLSSSEVDVNGLKFNKDWGSYNGQIKNASVNFYHKPFLNIVDEFKINDSNTLSTSVYFSVGYGGGRWSESFNYAPSIFSYRNYSGQINWDAIYQNNATHEQSYILANGETVDGFSLNVQTNFLASHVQTGIITNFEHKINQNMTFIAGLHYRYFNSFVREEIYDLLGGKFFIEDYSWSLAGVAGRNQIKTVGDIIRVDNNSIINFANSYAQLVYDNKSINSFISVNINNNWYSRVDRFNYIENQKSKIISNLGWDVRAGFLYNINEYQNIYVNAASISRAPYFKFVFGNYTNVVVHDLKNETINTIEFGYKLNWNFVTTNINIYATNRQNVSTLSNEYIQLESNTQTRAMINGLNAIHKGIEFETRIQISQNTHIGGLIAIGDFRWQNNVSARLFNDNNIVVDTVDVYAKDLFIGGTAQQQFGVFVGFEILKTLYLKAEYLYFANLYADFDATSRNNPNDLLQPYQIPSYGLFNSYLEFPFTINKYHGNIQLKVFNVLNKKYITLGEDGVDHNLDTFKGFWSFGRNFTFSMKFNF
ncbi:MAG: TonB-dependent receptor plug domain-containing protein [Bacteroidota bacterium]